MAPTRDVDTSDGINDPRVGSEGVENEAVARMKSIREKGQVLQEEYALTSKKFATAPTLTIPSIERACDTTNVKTACAAHSERPTTKAGEPENKVDEPSQDLSEQDALTLETFVNSDVDGKSTEIEPGGVEDGKLKSAPRAEDVRARNLHVFDVTAYSGASDSFAHSNANAPGDKPLARALIPLLSFLEVVNETAAMEPAGLESELSKRPLGDDAPITLPHSVREFAPSSFHLTVACTPSMAKLGDLPRAYGSVGAYLATPVFKSTHWQQQDLTSVGHVYELPQEAGGRKKTEDEPWKDESRNDARTFGIYVSQGNDGQASSSKSSVFGSSGESPLLCSVILPAAISPKISAHVSAIRRTGKFSYLGHPLDGNRTPYRGWEREGIGTGDWKLDVAGAGARERI
ncbi:hypothetical protein B0H11DRAFT_2264321 [Mycena galericulata]|nr:hypothetical protein B0H11DRAFT_2264321 [Mycena galericulata]